VRPGAIAGGGTLSLEKSGGTHWLWSGFQQLSGRQLEYNDLGYLDRKNDTWGSYALTYRTVEPWWRTVETATTLTAYTRYTLDGIDLSNQLTLSTSLLLTSWWSVRANLFYKAASHDDREIGDGTALERASRAGGDLAIVTDGRRRLAGSITGQAVCLPNGRHYELRGDVTVRALPQLEFDLYPAATWDEGEPRYVATTGADTYLFGAQEARSLGVTTHAAYTFTPELSLQLYAQAFLARVHYTSFFQGQTTAPRTRLDLASLAPAAAPATSPDTLTSTLNVNVVVRWEFRLGSTLFFVYTRAQTPALVSEAGGATSLDLRPIVHGRAAIDVVMVKLAYWF
jgi:hypothetical protein